MEKLVYCILLLFFAQNLLAQQTKIEEAYVEEDYEKCLKLCEKAKEKNANDLEALLYGAMVWVQRVESEEYQSTEATNKALQELSSLRRKDRNRIYIKEHLKEYDFVRLKLLAEADKLAASGEIEKSMELYTRIMNHLQDMRTHFYVGCSWINYNSPHLGIRYMNMGMENYLADFKTNKTKPEPEFLQHLLQAAEKLSELELYMPSLNVFDFAYLMYAEENKEIETAHDHCLEFAIKNIKASNQDLKAVLEKAKETIKKRKKKEWSAALKKMFVQNLFDQFLESYQKAEKELPSLETALQLALETLENPTNTLELINENLLESIYNSYKEKKEKSSLLYGLYLSLNGKEKSVQKCLDYGLASSSVFMKANALLIYRESGEEMKLIAEKIKAFEETVNKRAKKLTDTDKDFDELIYWLRNFPEFLSLRSTAKTYFLEYSKELIGANKFSKAGLFLLRAQENFPKDKGFETLKKQCVEKDYKLNYLGSVFGENELGWTGSVENCDPGKISPKAQQKVIQRYDFIRRLAGLPDGTVLDSEENEDCQAAALCMLAEGKLSHRPSEDWACYSKAAARGARNNLGIGGIYGTSACIDGMIEDMGPNNKATGHRRNLLSPGAKGLAHGATTKTVSISASSNERHSESTLARYNAGFICWPPKGPVPPELVFERWSFKPYHGNFNIQNPTVKMYLDGKELDVFLEHETTQKLGWIVENFEPSGKEQRIKVVIEADYKFGYQGGTEHRIFEYEVIIFPIAH